MSQVIEDRIIELELVTDDLEANAKEAIKIIDNLKSSLNLDAAAENLTSINQAAKKVDLSAAADSVDGLSEKMLGKISTLKIAVGSALGNIFSGLTKDLLINPINQAISGGIARSQKIADAKFQLEGLGVKWSEISNDIDYAVDGTAFGLDSAAKAASQFAASGVKLGDDMKTALRAISGVAAMGASTYDEIAPIFTKAAGQNRVMADELNRISTHGLSAAAELAKFFNTIEANQNVTDEMKKKILDITGGMKVTEAEIRDFASKSKISFDIFAKAMDEAFGEHAKDANNTFTGSLDNMKAALSRIGQDFRAPIMDASIDVFNSLRLMINAVRKNLSPIAGIWERIFNFVSKIASSGIDKITTLLSGNIDNMQRIANGILNIIYIIGRNFEAIGKAFKNVFGSGKDSPEGRLTSLAEKFEMFTRKLIPSQKALATYQKGWETFLTILKNISAVISPIARTVFPIFMAGIQGIGKAISLVTGLLAVLITNLFTFAKASTSVKDFFGKIKDAILTILPVSENFKAVFNSVLTVIGNVVAKIGDFAKIIGYLLLGAVGVAITGFINLVNKLKSVNFSEVINQIKNFINGLKEIPIVTKAIDNIKLIFEGLKQVFISAITSVLEFFGVFRKESSTTRDSVTRDMSGIQKVVNGVITVLKTIGGVLGGAVLVGLNLFNKAFEFLRNFKMESVIEAIRNFVASVKEIGLLNTLTNTFQNISGKIGDILRAIITKIREFIQEMKDSDSIIEFIIGKIQNLISKFIDFKNSVLGSLFGGELTRSGENNALTKIITFLGKKFTWLKEKASDAMDTIVKKGLLTKTLMVAYVLAILRALITFTTNSKKVTEALTSDGGFLGGFKGIVNNLNSITAGINNVVNHVVNPLDSLSNAITAWGEAQKKSGAENFAIVMKSFAVALLALAASLAALYFVVDDIDKFKQIAIVIGIFMASIAAIAGVMTVISSTKLVDQSFFNSFAANVISMAMCIGVMGLLINAISKLDLKQLGIGVLGLLAVLTFFVITQAIMSKINKAGVTIAATIKGVLKIAGKITLFASSLVLIAAGIAAMAAALHLVKDLNLAGQNGEMDNLIMGLMMIGSIFAAVIIASKFATLAVKGILEISGALALLGLAALELVLTSLIMKAVDLESLEKMGTIMIVLAMIFGILAKGLGGNEAIKGVLQLSLAIQMLTIAMFNISLLALLMRNMDLHDFDKPMIILTVLEAMLAALVIICSKASGGLSFKPLVTMIVGLTVIFGELMILAVLCSEEKTFQDILKATGILIALMLSFAAIIAAIGTIKTGKSVGPIVAALVGMGLIFAGVIALAYMTPDDDALRRLMAIIVSMGLLMVAMFQALEHFLRFAKSIDAGRGKFVVKAMAAFGIMVGGFVVMAAALALAAHFADGYQVAAMAVTIGAAMIALCYAAELIIKSTKKVKWKEIGKATAVMFILVAVVGALALVIAGISNLMNDGEVSRAMGGGGLSPMAALILVIAELTLVALAFKQIGKIKLNEIIMATAVMGVLVLLFTVLAGVLAIVGTMPIKEGILGKSQVIVLVLAELVLISGALGFLAAQGLTSLAVIPSLLILVGIFTILALVSGALNVFGGDAKGMIAKTQIVMLVLVELVAISAALGFLASQGVLALASIPALTALTIIFGILALVAGSLNVFGGDAKGMIAKTQIVILVLVELGVIMGLLGLIAPFGLLALASIPALLALTIVFGLLSLIMIKLNEVDVTGMDKKIASISLFLTELVGIMAIMALLSAGAVGMVAGGAALLLIATALVPLTASLQNLQTVDLTTVSAGLELLAQALGMLTEAGVGAMVLGAGLMVMALGIGSVGIACMIAAPGIIALAVALMMLAPAILSVGATIGILVTMFQTAFQEILTNLSEFPQQLIDMLISGFADLGSKLYNSVKKFAANIEQGFRDATGWHSPIPFVNKFFMQMGYDINENTDTTAWIAEKAGNKIGKVLPEGMSDGLKDGLPGFLSNMFGAGSMGSQELYAGFMEGGGVQGIMGWLSKMGLATSNLAQKQRELVAEFRKGGMSSRELNERMAALNDTTDQSLNLFGDLTEGLGDYTTATGKASGATKDFASTLTDTLTNQLNIFSKFEAKNPMNKDELLNNMKSQIKGMTDWAANMSKLATMGIDQGLYKKLAEMGPEGAEYVGAFVSMTAEELGMANELWAESLVLPGAVAKQIGVNMNEVGQNTLIGFQNGLDAQTNQTLAQLGVIANTGVDTFAEGVGTQSPSWKFEDMAINCLVGFINGLDSKKYQVYWKVAEICNMVVDIARHILDPEKFIAMGAGIVDGLVAGIEESKPKLVTAAEELASIADKVSELLKINSPSKVFAEIGSAIPEGMAKGITDNVNMVDNAVGNMADNAVAQMKNTIANIASMINDEMEDPVITPVLDLSKVQAGVRTLNSTFSTNQALMAGSQLPTLQNGQYNPQGGMQFIQNNYSPKALSRIDIYRDTRNMLNNYKQAMS